MRLLTMSLKKKLLFNFLIMIFGVFFITVVTAYEMLHFKDVLRGFLFDTGMQNIYYKQIQYDIARLEGFFHDLSNASDKAEIVQDEKEVMDVITHLEAMMRNLKEITTVPDSIRKSGEQFQDFFSRLAGLREYNLNLQEQRDKLLRSLSLVISRNKGQLLTILDNNQFSIYQAEEKIKGAGGNVRDLAIELLNRNIPPFKDVLDLIGHFDTLEVAAARVAALQDGDYLQPQHEILVTTMDSIGRSIGSLRSAAVSSSDEDAMRGIQQSLSTLRMMLLSEQGIVTRQRTLLNSQQAYRALLRESTDSIASISNAAAQIANTIDSEARSQGSETIEALQRIVKTILLTFFGLLVVGAILSALIWHSIVAPLQQGVEFAKAISDGDYTATLERSNSDELGRLANALNLMAANLRKQDWLKSGKATLGDTMRGELNIASLCRNTVSFLAGYVNAAVGVLYVVDPDSDQQLFLAGSYAFTIRRNTAVRYQFGESLVGQAALERETFLLPDIPRDYHMKVKSGLGQAVPRQVLIIPLVTDDAVKGVLELGFLNDITDDVRDFLQQIAQSVAVTIEAVQSRFRVQRLLDQTQEQANRLVQQQDDLKRANQELESQTRALRESEATLQQQQEELRVTNEELEEQARALKESESSLQSQQERLRVINEELEHRTKELEQQRDAMKKQNADLVLAQTEIVRKAREVELASKYKSEFLANMSHELRTPLNSILILSQLMSANKDENLTPKQIEFINTIKTSGSDLLGMINEILDLAKVEAGKLELRVEDLHLDELTGSLYRVFQPLAANKGLSLTMDIGDGIPAVLRTDPQRVQQVLRNLMSNALKFTEKGGVALHIARPDAQVRFTNSRLRHATTVAFSVEDTGIGIPQEKQDLIFEAFQQADGTTSRRYGGTGLGLSIAREMSLVLGGEIQLRSEDGHGSRFTLFLPERPEVEPAELMHGSSGAVAATPVPVAASEAPVPPAAPGAEAPFSPVQEAAVSRVADAGERGGDAGPLEETDWSPWSEPEGGFVPQGPGQVRDDRRSLRRGDKSLLIIEDDPVFAERLLDLAHSKGFRCLVAETADIGLHFADYYRPSAIILDTALPSQAGWEVMDRLKANPETRSIPVHFVSPTEQIRSTDASETPGVLTMPAAREEIDAVFGRIRESMARPLRSLLLVEDNFAEQQGIADLMSEKSDAVIETVATGEDALELLRTRSFDCLILDLSLGGAMSGFSLLEHIREDPSIARPATIIYTGRDLTRREEAELARYSESIIIKGTQSLDRLVDEATLFLHQVEADLPRDKQRKLRMSYDKEAAFLEKRILLVDDDMRNVFALASVLEEKGLHVVEATDGKEALARLTEGPPIHLVLMDIMMPEMDGYQAIRKIRELDQYRKTPIIALTAKAMKGDRAKCIEAGANDYLAKPVDTAKLLSLLRVWLSA